jgi:hypothetical protein
VSTENTWAAGYAAALADLRLIGDLRERYNVGMVGSAMFDTITTECAALRSGADWLADGGAGVWRAIPTASEPDWEARRSTPPEPAEPGSRWCGSNSIVHGRCILTVRHGGLHTNGVNYWGA